MAYNDIADEASGTQMARAWGVPYATVQQVIRMVQETPLRSQHNRQWYDRPAQIRIGTAVEHFLRHPKLLFRSEKLRRAQLAYAKESTEAALQDEIDRLKTQLRAMATDDDALLSVRLLHPCARLTDLDHGEFVAFQDRVLDEPNVVILFTGAIKLLVASLNGACRRNEARVLSDADVMAVAHGLQTVADIGKQAEARLDKYDCEAQAILAKESSIDRTPEEVQP